MAANFLGIKIEDWLPPSPLVGPPLPRAMGIVWPWYKPPAPPEEAPPEVPEVPPVGKFAYVSTIARHAGTNAYDYFTVDVKNVGDIAGTCTLEFWTNHTKRGSPYVWTGWELVATVSHTLQPGQVKTFGDESCRCYVTGRDNWVMWYVEFRGEPGVIAKSGKHWE